MKKMSKKVSKGKKIASPPIDLAVELDSQLLKSKDDILPQQQAMDNIVPQQQTLNNILPQQQQQAMNNIVPQQQAMANIVPQQQDTANIVPQKQFKKKIAPVQKEKAKKKTKAPREHHSMPLPAKFSNIEIDSDLLMEETEKSNEALAMDTDTAILKTKMAKRNSKIANFMETKKNLKQLMQGLTDAEQQQQEAPPQTADSLSSISTSDDSDDLFGGLVEIAGNTMTEMMMANEEMMMSDEDMVYSDEADFDSDIDSDPSVLSSKSNKKTTIPKAPSLPSSKISKRGGGECTIDLVAWGYEDSNRRGYIKVDKKIIADIKDTVDSSSRGFHFVTLLCVNGAFKVDKVEQFDTWASSDESESLGTFIDDLPDGTIVACATADEVSKNLGPCRKALTSLGVDTYSITYRSSVAFLAKKGDPSYIVQQAAERNNGPVRFGRIITEDGIKGEVKQPEPLWKSKKKKDRKTKQAITKVAEPDGMDSMGNVIKKVPFNTSGGELLRQKAKLKSIGQGSRRITLEREKLFDEFKVKEYYPLEKLKDLFTVDNVVIARLDLTGIDQLTDLFFCMVKVVHKNSLFCKSLQSVSLQGCYHITDTGIRWMIDTFPHLTGLNISGCKRLTEKSLTYLLAVPELESISARGIDAGVVYFTDLDKTASLKLNGCPLVSPPLAPTVLTRNHFFKDLAKTDPLRIYKAVIVNANSKSFSLLDFLSSKGVSTSPPKLLCAKQDLQLSNQTFNIVECSQELVHLFATKRTVYVLPYDADDGTKSSRNTLLPRLLGILSQVGSAAFIVLGLSRSGKPVTAVEDIKHDLQDTIQKLQQTLKTKTKDMSTQLFVQQMSMDFATQQVNTQAYVLLEALECLMDCITFTGTVDFNKKEDYQIFEKALIGCEDLVNKQYPEYQRMSEEFNSILNSVKKTSGVVSEKDFIDALRNKSDTAKFGMEYGPYRKCLEILNLMGKLVYFPHQPRNSMVVSSLEWLAEQLNTKLSRSPDQGQGRQFKAVDKETLVLEKEEFDKTRMLLDVLLSKNMVVQNGDQLIVTPLLLPKPPVPLSHFVNEPVLNSCVSLVERYRFYQPPPASLMPQVIALAARLDNPSIMWDGGLVIQDPPVVMAITASKPDSAEFYIDVTAQGFQLVDSEDVMLYLWNVLDMYKVPVQYALATSNIFYTIETKQTVSGKTVDNPAKPKLIYGVSCGHLGTVNCTRCGQNMDAHAHLWSMERYLRPTLTLEGTFRADVALVQEKGNWFCTKPKDLTMTGLSFMSAVEFRSFAVTLLAGKAIKIGVEQQGIQDSNQRLIFIDVKLNQTSDKTQLKEHQQLDHGDILTVMVLMNKEKEKHHVTFSKNGDEIFSRDVAENVRLMPYIASSEQVTFLVDASSNPNPTGIDGNSWTVGSRLEAKDRLNPRLICVATVADKSEDGTVLIHFDGWTTRYDYWTETSSVDLHPIGYMAGTTSDNRSMYNPSLQAPKGYGKQFSWDTYLVEVTEWPVPYHLFDSKQTGGCPPYQLKTETIASLSQKAHEHKMVLSCVNQKNKPCALQKELLSKTAQVVEEFRNMDNISHYVIPLPVTLDVDLITYPALRATAEASQQNWHFLCSSDVARSCVHLMDVPGVEVKDENPKQPVYTKYTPLFTNCMLAMAQQKNFIPKICRNLFKGAENVKSEMIKEGLLKLFSFYTIMFYLEKAASRNNKDKMLKETEFLKKDLEGVKRTSKLESTLATLPPVVELSNRRLCTAHAHGCMDNSKLSQIPMETFSQYSHLITELDFSNNEITSMPSDFFSEFPELRDLSLESNRLSSIPDGIRACENIRTLALSYNRLTGLPQDFGDCSQSLEQLHMSGNSLKQLPSVLFKCRCLKVLFAEELGVTSLPDELGDLVSLETLMLGGNPLSALPKTFKNLKRLITLGLSGVAWIEGQNNPKTIMSREAFNQFLDKNPFLADLRKQKREDLFRSVDEEDRGMLDHKAIQKLNVDLYRRCPRFGKGNSEYGGCPSEIFELPSLEIINLSYQRLSRITEHFKTFVNLKMLDVCHNPELESLCAELGGLMHLESLPLRGCPVLNTPPKEIVNRGFQAVYGYLKRLAMGSVECKRTKLMLVGLGGAGKTSLVHSLTTKQSAQWRYDEEIITDGIDIMSWAVPTDKGELTFSVWDFAGQTVYYNTHQFFLSNRAVYLLLWNIRLGYEHAGLDFWLSSIACHAPKAPVLIVGSHKDQVEKFWLPQEEMQKRYPQIKGFHAISCYTGEGIQDLQKQLVEVTLDEKYMGEKIPEAWLKFEQRMFDEKKNPTIENNSLLPLEHVESLAVECGIFDKVEMNQAVQFLHDLGSVQHFQNEFLRSRVVIDPQWIVDAMSCVVSVHDTPIQEGRFFHKDLGKVWEKYDKNLLPWLLRLTEEFDLTFPVPNEAANIVPCMLPANTPEYHWPDISVILGYRETKMCYKFDYLPAGLFNRTQARLYQFSDSSVIWKKGSLLRKSGHMALMIVTDNDVMVKVQGPRPENVLFLVHEVFEGLITESFHGVSYDFFIPCTDCLKAGTHDPCMFPASKIRRAAELKAPFLQCDKYFHTLSLTELHAMMPPDSSQDFDVHLERSLHDLRDLRDDLAFDVFMLYSANNIPQLGEENKKVHPRRIYDDLQRAGLKVWFPHDPSAINMEQVAVTLREVKVVMICMSNEFVEDERCVQIFHLATQNMQKDTQLVLFGKNSDWMKTNLGLLIASEVYVSMMDASKYNSKIKELQDKLLGKIYVDSRTRQWPKCFISYCWSNSAQAIESSSRNAEGVFGWADPRKFREVLEEKKISCWMDVERVGQGGLFEDIAEGLRHAKLILACVSDEYARSRNCQMEFRFATVTLKIPLVVAVVGTGYLWESTEVGMLSLGWPKINFQHESTRAFERLIAAVEKMFPKEDVIVEPETPPESPIAWMDNNQMAFQELLELAQRKFLRQVTRYAESMDSSPFPKLFVMDFLTEEEKAKLKSCREGSTQNPPENKSEATDANAAASQVTQASVIEEEKPDEKETDKTNADITSETKSENVDTPRPGSSLSRTRPGRLVKRISSVTVASQLIGTIDKTSCDQKDMEHCVRILCEYDQGWHCVSEGLPLPEMGSAEFDDFLDLIAPYMARILAILKHSTLDLAILNTDKGETMRKTLEEKCGHESEFEKEYVHLRKMMMTLDDKNEHGKLARCHLPNGKTVWLCDQHQQIDRLTVLSNDDALISYLDNGEDDSLMAQIIDKEHGGEKKKPDQKEEAEKNVPVEKPVTPKKPPLLKRQSHSQTQLKFDRNIKARGKTVAAENAAKVAGGQAQKSRACSVM